MSLSGSAVSGEDHRSWRADRAPGRCRAGAVCLVADTHRPPVSTSYLGTTKIPSQPNLLTSDFGSPLWGGTRSGVPKLYGAVKAARSESLAAGAEDHGRDPMSMTVQGTLELPRRRLPQFDGRVGAARPDPS